MKPKNFPMRRLIKQRNAELRLPRDDRPIELIGVRPLTEAEVIAARAIRTKKQRVP